jgi:hypothetical protein
MNRADELPAFGVPEFGATPPPADGRARPCPSCIEGYQYVGGVEEGEVRCADCYGSGVQGDGWRLNREPLWPAGEW